MFWIIVGAILFCLLVIPLVVFIISAVFFGSFKIIFDLKDKVSEWFPQKNKAYNNLPKENIYNNIFRDLQNEINHINKKTEL